MRLLFIYFYKEHGTFNKGTIITTSKKYTVEKETEDFSFTLTKNSSFQDRFYGDNLDLGVLIGENGTGKSILINSLRDSNNDYAFGVFEKDDEFFITDSYNRSNVIEVNGVQVAQSLFHLNLDLIYYTPFVDI